MTGWQLVVVWLFVALAVFGIPGYALGWWNGRRILRAALTIRPTSAPAEIVRLGVEADTCPLPIAGRFPTEPPLLWSEMKAAGQDLERSVQQYIAEAERAIPPAWRGPRGGIS